MIEIRPAAVSDAGALAELRWEFRTSPGRDPAVEDHDAFVERCASWMRRELDGPTWRAWIAVDDGRIVGQVWAAIVPKIPNPVAERERHAYVSNFYVRPAARGGLGTRLLQHVLDWARANRIDYLVLWPSARSVSLYERSGFTRNGRVMELKV